MEMIRYTGTEALRIEDAQGNLEAYFSPGAQLAVGEHNAPLAETLLAREDFEEVEVGPGNPTYETRPITADAVAEE